MLKNCSRLHCVRYAEQLQMIIIYLNEFANQQNGTYISKNLHIINASVLINESKLCAFFFSLLIIYICFGCNNLIFMVESLSKYRHAMSKTHSI